MIHVLDGQPNRRLVMRAYKTHANLRSAAASTPIFLISLTQESLRKSLRAYVVPTLVAATAAQAADFANDLALPENTRSVIERRPAGGGEVRLITLP